MDLIVIYVIYVWFQKISSLRWALVRVHFKITLSDQIELHSVQLPLSFEILLWFFFHFSSFIFLLFFIVFLGKMGGPWTRSIFRWTRSMDQGSMFCTLPYFACWFFDFYGSLPNFIIWSGINNPFYRPTTTLIFGIDKLGWIAPLQKALRALGSSNSLTRAFR